MRLVRYLFAALAVVALLGAMPQNTPRSQIQRMVDQLNVTPEQKAKLDPILDEDAKQVRLLRGDTSAGAAEKKAAIRKDTDAKIKPILTADQWKKLEELRVERGNQDKKNQEKKKK
jgi:Spy/CpxP family protein refolding chaperone